MEKFLDLSYSSEYDLIVDKNKSLNVSINCVIVSGTTASCDEYNFSFSGYTGATLTVKNHSGTIVQTFSTTDGSIELYSLGYFKLIKTAEEMNTVRAGCYEYDMYLSSALMPKRGFLRGKITYIQNISN